MPPYDPKKRREEYLRRRNEILARLRADTALCPLCGIPYGRRYLPKHMEKRHKIIFECQEVKACATQASLSSETAAFSSQS